MKGFIKLIIVIAVLGGIWFAWEQWKGNEAIQVDYQTEPLEKGDLMITIDATGVTEPDELVDVGAQVSGIIMEFGKDLDGKVVGRIDCALIHTHFDGSVKAYLDWICVIKSYRHRGVAQGLMTALRRELKQRGVDTLIGLIASNEDARRFYRSLPHAEIKDEGIWIDL
mgnify:CR=1 FL=1